MNFPNKVNSLYPTVTESLLILKIIQGCFCRRFYPRVQSSTVNASGLHLPPPGTPKTSAEAAKISHVSMNENDAKPAPKTAEQIGDSIWTFYQDGAGSGEPLSDLLSDLLTAGKLELAIELLKVQQLNRIADDVEEIRLTGESTSAVLADIANSVRYLPQE
jgi:hypothetical protein